MYPACYIFVGIHGLSCNVCVSYTWSCGFVARSCLFTHMSCSWVATFVLQSLVGNAHKTSTLFLVSSRCNIVAQCSGLHEVVATFTWLFVVFFRMVMRRLYSLLAVFFHTQCADLDCLLVGASPRTLLPLVRPLILGLCLLPWRLHVFSWGLQKDRLLQAWHLFALPSTSCPYIPSVLFEYSRAGGSSFLGCV